MIRALHLTDFYKTDHRRQFPEGTQSVYSNFTARGSRIPGMNHVVPFGLQYFIKRYLLEEFDRFFSMRGDIAQYRRRLDRALGLGAVPMDHVKELWEFGRLPLRIKALPEGSKVPVQVPLLTVENTDPRFAWLTNFIETMLSATIWGPCTSATTAYAYRLEFERAAQRTGLGGDFCKWQGHDFSFRGMFGVEAAAMSGAAHLLSFTGTDTIPAIDFLEEYYGANADQELIGGSVPATEHAVMCANGDEEASIRRLLTEVYPSGIVSVVSDTWDFWRLVTEVLPRLKESILARDGKLVIRPDSGDPVKILCGDIDATEHAACRGLIQCLWDVFGGTTTPAGFRVLNSHVGAIYGDSITLDRQRQILANLAAAGFASSNVVLGIGSYTYQHVMRDTFGFAMKATQCVVNGTPRAIYKAPKTDRSKDSHRGLLAVQRDEHGAYCVRQDVSREVEENENLLETMFENGEMTRETTLAGIRCRIDRQIAADLEAIQKETPK